MEAGVFIEHKSIIILLLHQFTKQIKRHQQEQPISIVSTDVEVTYKVYFDDISMQINA